MVKISLHDRSMGEDGEDLKRSIGEDAMKRRRPHLRRLVYLKKMAQRLAPFNISYDVTCTQPPYFHEFTIKELMGCAFVCPQSAEIAAQQVEEATQCSAILGPAVGPFDVVDAIMGRDLNDKYDLAPVEGPAFKRVAFLPGTNLFPSMVSKELLVRAMHRYEDMVIKPHPLTDENTIRDVGRLFGYERILEPMASGWAYLAAAEDVYVTTATEMGLYAVLMGKRIHNITHFPAEGRGGFNPFYSLLWDLDTAKAREVLHRALNAPGSGFIHPEDPEAEFKMAAAFTLAMELRKPYRPRVHEYNPLQYASMVCADMRMPRDAVRPGEGRPREPDPEVSDQDG